MATHLRDPSTLPLPERIKWARRAMGLSHDRLAERLGTSRFTVIKWEKGLHRPGADYLRRLRDVTGQPDLFPEEDDDEESG